MPQLCYPKKLSPAWKDNVSCTRQFPCTSWYQEEPQFWKQTTKHNIMGMLERRTWVVFSCSGSIWLLNHWSIPMIWIYLFISLNMLGIPHKYGSPQIFYNNHWLYRLWWPKPPDLFVNKYKEIGKPSNILERTRTWFQQDGFQVS